MRDSSIHYLRQAGFEYKPVESPDLWNHLQSYFAGSNHIGARFNRMAASHIEELIAKGEEALLESMVEQHRRTGKLGEVTGTIDLPYIVGTEGMVPLASAVSESVVTLVDHPGSNQERIILVIPVDADAMPCTKQMTITGGLYSDGRTAGVFALYPGRKNAPKKGDKVAYLATHAEIKAMARDMEQKVDDIALITRKECDEMLKKVRKILK